MEFVLVNKFFKVGKTAVSIQCDKPFTFFTRELEGDRLGDTDETLIEAVKEILRTELDPTSAIVKNQEQLAKTTAALERSNQLMEGMQKLSLRNTDDIEEILARLEVLEKHNGIEHEHEDEAEGPHVSEAETHSTEPAPVTQPVQPEPQPVTEAATNGVPNVVVSEAAPAQPTTEQPVVEAPTQPAPAVEQPTESETEHEILTPTSEASTSENNGGSNNE